MPVSPGDAANHTASSDIQSEEMSDEHLVDDLPAYVEPDGERPDGQVAAPSLHETGEAELSFTIEFRSGNVRVLRETTTWLCYFTEADVYNHIYVCEAGRVFVVFECPELMQTLCEMGFPIQSRRYPTDWDEEALRQYLEA